MHVPFYMTFCITSTRIWGPAVPTEIWSSQLRSGSAHWNLELAVEVRQCTLRSGACGWGLAVPTAIRSSLLRSGSDLELAVEVRHWSLACGWGLAVPTAIRSSLLRSGSAQWDLEEVRHCPLRSGACSWGPAVPIAISSLRLRSGRAQSNLELVVEVRQRPLRSGARSCGLAVPTAIRSSQLRSGSGHSDLGLAVEVRTDGRKDEETEEVSLIKSRGCLKALTRQVGNSNNMFAEFGSTQQFHKNSLSLQLCFQKTTCLTGPSGQQALCGYPNDQLVFSRRQLKMGHPSRLGLGTSCDQL